MSDQTPEYPADASTTTGFRFAKGLVWLVYAYFLFAMIILVLTFQNSSNLAAAYGIAVTGAVLRPESSAYIRFWIFWAANSVSIGASSH